MSRYDPQAIADLVKEEADLAAEFTIVSNKLHDMNATDGPFSDEQQGEYGRLGIRHGQLDRELRMAREKRQAMEMRRPDRVKATAITPLARFLKGGYNGLEQDEINLHSDQIRDDLGFPLVPANCEAFLVTPSSMGQSLDPQAATRSDDTSGQELVQETVVPDVVERLAYYGGIARCAYQFMTATGNDYRIPQHDESTTTGTILANQATDVSAGNLANFTVQRFGAHTCTSNSIRVTREMLQDSVIDLDAFVRGVAVRRMGRSWDQVMTTGSGTNEPNGVVGLSKDGIVTASGTAVTWPEIVNLQYQVNRAYREGMGETGEGGKMAEMGGKVGYLISDAFEQAVRVLSDGDSRPLWTPAIAESIAEGRPSMIFGKPYEVSAHLSGIAASTASDTNIPALYGNFSYYGIRTVAAVAIYRFMDSRTMQQNAIDFLAFSRRDGNAMGAVSGGRVDAIARLRMAGP